MIALEYTNSLEEGYSCSLFAGEFRKDVIRAVVVAVVAASIVASVVALAADRYFGDTVSGLIGDAVSMISS